MPYAEKIAGIYVIKNCLTGNGYVGQSSNMRKRIADHFNLLRSNKHPNSHLQRSFNKYGEDNFSYDFEIVCEDLSDLTLLEEMYLSGSAVFDDTPIYYNISNTAHEPMRGRFHTSETKIKISESKKGRRDHINSSYLSKLSAAQIKRSLSDPERRKKIKFIVENPHLSYAERGRRVGLDTSTVRKFAIKYTPIKEILDGEY